MISSFKHLPLILISVSVPMAQRAIQDGLLEMSDNPHSASIPVEVDKSLSNYIETISENIIITESKKVIESVKDENENTDEESDESDNLDDPDFDPTRCEEYVPASPTSSTHSVYRPPKSFMTEEELIPGKQYSIFCLMTKINCICNERSCL